MLKKYNNKFKPGQRIISLFAIILISAVYFSFIPFDIISDTPLKSCCQTDSETAEISSGKEFLSNTCSCCTGVCRCAFKEKSAADLPFNGIPAVSGIPDLPVCGDNFFTNYNIYAIIFKDSPPYINTGNFSSKVPIYILKSSMLC